jgi:flagellar protein FliS
MVQRLTDANIQNSIEILDEISGLLAPIRDAWLQIPESAKQEAYELKRQNQQAV